MGARVARMIRDFNLENRVQRQLSKEKPTAAPRHETSRPPTTDSPAVEDSVKLKNDSLLTLLRSVYVESTDPAAEVSTKEVTVGETAERRPIKYSLSVNMSDLAAVTDVPKGKLTIVEALKAVGSHQHQPQTWTPEKIAQEYSLDLKDTKDLLEFFIPFKVQIISPETKTAKQIKDS